MKLLRYISPIYRKTDKRIRNMLKVSQLRSDDVFLVSYPRSGNTWLRTILAYMLYDASLINSLKDVQYYVPDFYQGIPKHHEYSNPRIIKSHEPFFSRDGAHRLELYRRNIYILRHPYKVAPSCYHYQLELYPNPIKSFDEFVNKFVDGYFYRTTWSEHVLSWYKERNNREIFFLRYEDLKDETEAVIEKVAAFLEQDCTSEKIQQIIGFSSREAMVELEKRGSLVSSDFEFVSRKADKPRMDIVLSDEQKARIWEVNKEAMQLFDYSG